MSRTFYHSGDLGDIVYSLPTIRNAGGGKLHLYNHPGRTSHGMSEFQFKSIEPLLSVQPYIEEAKLVPYPVSDCYLNGFRDHIRGGKNLADAHACTFGYDWTIREKRWLSLPEHCKYSLLQFPVIIAKTQRYPNHRFPWARIIEKYKGKIGYIGFASEHEWFCNTFGPVQFIDAPNALSMAVLVAQSKLYIGNFTLATAIAEGLKHPSIVEVCPECASLSTHVRLNCALGFDEKIELPDLEDL